MHMLSKKVKAPSKRQESIIINSTVESQALSQVAGIVEILKV